MKLKTMWLIQKVNKLSWWYFIDAIFKINIKNRKGECTKCGKCCFDFTIGKNCKYLKNKKCTVYDNRPDICDTKWPINQQQLDRFYERNPKSKCGYYFEED